MTIHRLYIGPDFKGFQGIQEDHNQSPPQGIPVTVRDFIPPNTIIIISRPFDPQQETELEWMKNCVVMTKMVKSTGKDVP